MTFSCKTSIDCSMRFTCADRFIVISNADSAKNFIKVISTGNSVEFTPAKGEKFTVAITDKAAAIFKDVITSRIVASGSIEETRQDRNITNVISSNVECFPCLSIVQLTELLNLAFEPISNQAWVTHVQKFNPKEFLNI